MSDDRPKEFILMGSMPVLEYFEAWALVNDLVPAEYELPGVCMVDIGRCPFLMETLTTNDPGERE